MKPVKKAASLARKDGRRRGSLTGHYVEDRAVVKFDTLKSKGDQFLTWRAAFTVFAQNPRHAVEVAPYLATVLALRRTL